MKKEKECNHSTDDELRFLCHIGAHRAGRSDERRMSAVRGYINAAKNRTDWGEIDKERVIAYALRLITA